MSKKKKEAMNVDKNCELLLAIQNAVDRFEPDFESLTIVLGSFITDVMEQLDNFEKGLGYKWRNVFVDLLNKIDITEYENEESES